MSENEESNNGELYDVSDIEDSISSQKPTEQSKQVIEYRDASTIAAEILVGQIGSDKEFLIEGKTDPRVLTNITPRERTWLSYFYLNIDDMHGGEWIDQFSENWMRLSRSLDGLGLKLAVSMQGMLAGTRKQEPKKDTRSFTEKHFTKRGQEPKELLDVG